MSRSLNVLFDSMLARKKVKPTARDMLSIVVMATHPHLKTHSLWRNTLPTDAISAEEFSLSLVHQSHAFDRSTNRVPFVLILGPPCKLGFEAPSHGDLKSASHGLELSHYAGIYHHRPTTWIVRRDWRPQSREGIKRVGGPS